MCPNRFARILNSISILILVSIAVIPINATAQIPVTGGSGSGSSYAPISPSLALFIDTVKNGSTQQITGIFIDNLLSFPVVQQPSDQPAYVSPIDDQVTQFQSASAFGSVGFVAHNTLAGSNFSEINNGELISIIFGDGHYTQYQVIQIRRLQAVQPDNPYSSFIDLSNNQMLTVQEVFYQTYGVKDQLILQTCISSQGINSWGRLFVIATPFTPATSQIAVSLASGYFQSAFRSVLAVKI